VRSLSWAVIASALACAGCEALFPTELGADAGADATQPALDGAGFEDGASDATTPDGPATDSSPSADAAKDGSPMGSCADGGVCKPDAGSQSCGCGGTQQCGPDCLWGGCTAPDCPSGVICNGGTCCSAVSVCQPGAMQSPTCAAGPACGSQPETCDMCGQWVAQGSCTGQTGCSPGSQQGCNTYGTQTCQPDCTWGACSCPLAPVCVPWSLAVSGQSPGDGPICTGTASGANCCIQGNNVCGGAECCGSYGTTCDACGQCDQMMCICLC
jgi:hypothetical protein